MIREINWPDNTAIVSSRIDANLHWYKHFQSGDQCGGYSNKPANAADDAGFARFATENCARCAH
jgi:hypothetical protein